MASVVHYIAQIHWEDMFVGLEDMESEDMLAGSEDMESEDMLVGLEDMDSEGMLFGSEDIWKYDLEMSWLRACESHRFRQMMHLALWLGLEFVVAFAIAFAFAHWRYGHNPVDVVNWDVRNILLAIDVESHWVFVVVLVLAISSYLADRLTTPLLVVDD